MKMNKKIVIGLAMLATAMMIVVPFAVMQDGVDADYEYKVITDNGLYIAPAILNDTSDTPIEISDYGTISLSGNVITLTLSEAYYHKNGEGNYGFWMGVAFASVDTTKDLYYKWDKSGTEEPTDVWDTPISESNVLIKNDTSYNGVAFYVAPGNVETLNANSEYYVALKVAGGNVVNYTVKVVVEKYSVSTAVALQTALKAKGTINIDITDDIAATIGTDINLENPADINCRFFGATNYVSDITVNGNEHEVSISGTVDGHSSVSVFYFINGENPEPNVPVSNLVKPEVSINKLTVDSNITVGTSTHQHGFNAYGDKASVTYTEVTSKNNKSAGFSVSGGAEVTLKACGTEGNSAATVGTPWAAVRVGSDDEIATANIGTGCVFKEQLPLWAESENAKVKFSDTETWLESKFAILALSISKTLYYKDGSIPAGTFPTVTIGTSVAYTFTLGKGTWTSPGVITVPDSCTMVIGDDGSFAFGSSSSIVSENKVTGKILCSEKEIKVEDFKGTLTYDAAGPKLTNYTSGTITQSTSAIKANVADYGSSIPVYTDYKVTQTGNNATATISGLVAHRNAHTVYSYWSGVGFEPALAGATGFQYYWADEAGTISWSDTQDLGTDTSVMFYVPGGTIQKFIAIKWIYETTGGNIENEESFNVSFNTSIKSGAFAAPTGNIIVRGTFANGISLTSGSITTEGDTAGPITGNVTCGTDALSLEAFDGSITASDGKMEVSAWTAGTLGITKGTVNMATTIGAEQTLDLAKGVTLGVLAGKTLTLEGKIINNGTIDVYGTLDSSACGGDIGTKGVTGSGVLNVYNGGEFKMGAATPISEIPTGQFLGTMNIYTGGELAGITSGSNPLIELEGADSYLQVVSKSTKTVRNVEYSLFGTGSIDDATAYAGTFFAAGDKLVVAKGAELNVDALTINSAVNLTIEGTVIGDTIYIKGAGSIVIEPTGEIDDVTIDFQNANKGTKVITVKQNGKITAVLDGSDGENKVSVLEVENIVAGVGGIFVTKGSVYINGVMATADATGTITIPAAAPGSVVYVSGTVEEGVKVVVPAGTSVVVPKETTLTFETDSELSYEPGATIGFEDATSAIIYEKGSVVNDVVIEVETKEDTNGTVTAVHIYLVSENEKKLIISVNYVEVLPGKTYGDALNDVIVMPTKKTVTFDGWYNLAFNEKIRSTDIVGNYDVVLTACYSEEGRVIPVPDDDDSGSSDVPASSSNINEFALPIAFILLVCSIFALGFVIIRKK